MNPHLLSALKELEAAHAEILPKAATVEMARDGKVWSGKTKDGGFWKLIKNSSDSYTTNTHKND